MNIVKSLLKKMFSKNKTNMELEIYEQPDIILELIKKYIKKDYSINIDLPDNVQKVVLIASGSSYHSAAIAANYLRTYAHCDAQAFYSSEVSLAESFDVDTETLYIFISQSGETSDTNKALNIVKATTDKILSITNSKNSSLDKAAKYKVLVHAGKENSIASTKALSAQIFCLFLIAAKIMQQKELPVKGLVEDLIEVPAFIKNAFENREEIKKFAKCFSCYDCAAVLGSGMFYPLAKEGALKTKETSYINTIAYPTGEFLHGHIATLNKKCAVLSLVNNASAEFSKGILDKVNAEYKTDSFVISAVPVEKTNKNVVITTNTKSDIDFMFFALVVIQLLAFETALQLKRNIDSPDGLTKIVK